MPRLTDLQGRILILALAFICIFIRFNDIFQTPNSRVIEPYGDGFKAYTVILYHAKYDSTYSWFEGMNYPYGDHAVPGTTQPIVSGAIKFISRHLVDIADYTIGIVNFSMLLSIWLCSFFLYLIFRQLKLPVWYAVLVALGLTFLAPQTHRMIAHYGLAHPVVVPLTLYLLLLFDRRPRLRTSIALGLLLIGFSLVHFYYLALLGMTISFYFLFHFLYRFDGKRLPGLIFHYGVQVALPALLLFIWITSTDRVDDRNMFPWGFFHYRAYLEGVFTSLSQPYFRWIDEHVISFRHLDFESLSYIGLVAGLAFIYIMGQWARHRFQVLPIRMEVPHIDYLNKIFFTALAILLFSLGLPFIIPGLEPLLGYTGPIRQFRSIGRFAWVFYFVMNILAFTWVYQEACKRVGWRRTILFAALGLLYFEAYSFTRSFSIAMEEVKEFKEGQRFTDLKIDYNQFQAIHPVPYHNLGSGNFWWAPEGFVLQKSLTLSIQTGLPVTSAMLTRTSLSHTLYLFQLATPPYRMPRPLEALDDDRPFLMVWDQREYEKEKERYRHLLEGAELLYEEERLKLYKLPLETFAERIERRKAQIRQELAADSLLYRHGDLLSSDSLRNFIFIPNDNAQAGKWYRGGGGWQATGENLNVLYDGPLPGIAADSQYIYSQWMFVNAPLRGRSELEFTEYSPEDGQWLQHQRRPVRYFAHIFDDNGWMLMRMPFKRLAADSHIRMAIQNEEIHRDPLFLDELLIRARATDLYQRDSTGIWKNNLWFPGQ